MHTYSQYIFFVLSIILLRRALSSYTPSRSTLKENASYSTKSLLSMKLGTLYVEKNNGTLTHHLIYECMYLYNLKHKKLPCKLCRNNFL